MAIVSCKEVAEQRRGPTFAGDGSYHRTYTRVFQVITDNYLTGGLQALIQGAAIPRLFSIYDTRPQGGAEFDQGALLIGYDPYQPDKDTPNLWYVRCDYASRHLDPEKVSALRNAGSPDGGGGFNENPLLRPTIITVKANNQRRSPYTALGVWKFTDVVEIGSPFDPLNIPFFTDGPTAFMNSAGQPFSPGPEIIAPQATITYQRNEPSFNIRDRMFYWGKVNSAPWLGFDAGEVFCEFIDGQEQFENGIPYVAVTYQFQFRRSNFVPDSPGEPWDWAVIDQGTYYYDVVENVQSFTDSNGNPTTLGLLDGDGGALDTITQQPMVFAFRTYDRTDFNALHLP